jgi:hypothetical protein
MFIRYSLLEFDKVYSLFNGERVGILLPVVWDGFFYG